MAVSRRKRCAPRPHPPARVPAPRSLPMGTALLDGRSRGARLHTYACSSPAAHPGRAPRGSPAHTGPEALRCLTCTTRDVTPREPAETRCISSQFSSQTRVKRRVSWERTTFIIDSLQRSANSQKWRARYFRRQASERRCTWRSASVVPRDGTPASRLASIETVSACYGDTISHIQAKAVYSSLTSASHVMDTHTGSKTYTMRFCSAIRLG